METEKIIEDVEQEPEIDGMEKNLEDGFNADPLADAFENESNIVDIKPEKKEEPAEEKKKIVEEKQEVVPVVEKPDPEKIIEGLQQTVAEERRKKRDAQQRVYDLSQAADKPEKKPFSWDDPDKTLTDLATDIEAKISTKFETRLLDLSAAQCKARHDDYDEKERAFLDLAEKNTAVAQEALNSADPAEFAYQYITKKIEMDEIGNDPAAYRAKLKEEMKAEILAELKPNKIEQKIQAVTKLPPSADSIKGKVTDKVAELSDDPLNDAFGDR